MMFETRAPWDEEGKYTLDRIGVSISNPISLLSIQSIIRSTMKITRNMNWKQFYLI